MKSCGAKEFQLERTELISKLIEEACEDLIKNKIKISASKVSDKIDVFFKVRNIDSKFHVEEQSISRNFNYSKIWKPYKKKQLLLDNSKLRINKLSKYDEFELRDKFDLLQQDFIELYDYNTWIQKNNNELKLKLENSSNNKIENPQILEIINIFKTINTLLTEGSVIITKNKNNIIIKSAITMDDSKKFAFTFENWNRLLQ